VSKARMPPDGSSRAEGQGWLNDASTHGLVIPYYGYPG
jgi:hypothetical protein